MEDHRLEGLGHQLKGAVKQSIGKAIGDAKLTADGTTERTIGDQQVAAGAGLDGGDQLFGIDTGRVMGIVNQFKGALMQGVGSLVGNPKLQADGIAQQQAGKAQNAVGSIRDEERQATEKREATAAADEKAEPSKAEPYNDGSRP
jgi:uncharacterized protein YjbJ (UPF0337 family)